MPKITRIYTRGGDRGETSLVGGQRVRKDTLRIEVFGTVDELNSMLGVALSHGTSKKLTPVLRRIQNELFHLGSDLAILEEDKETLKVPQIEKRHVDALESLIDDLNGEVGELENFILPGGTPTAAALHVARTLCRRAERLLVTLMGEEAVGAQTLPYLNRLSDGLFVMARYENHVAGVPDPLWDSRA
ncbi:MAG: cob(I)yrinic acid a,c-diamide adenosyltransferase [Acidobacteriota bacterium]|nr:cob(I)yrinic acid a,c-diamide adenosyltransferase [Acidobacteriota bacterium]MDH3784199.1 cob(I)yrinic acid a,c-diamide adenosyltransferase [Acidobacteriota bacterium]